MYQDYKFNVGDIVRVVQCDSLKTYDKELIGFEGEVAVVDSNAKKRPYAVINLTGSQYEWFEESALELIKKGEK